MGEKADETRLLDEVARGDHDALARLYDRFERPVFSLAVQTLGGDRQRAEEVVQDTFMKVWRGASTYDDALGSPSSWIFTIARRTAIDLWRRESRRPVPSEASAEVASGAPDVGDEAWAGWELNKALVDLPDDQRVAIDLFVVMGYTHVQIAEQTGIPLGTVKTRIYAGLRALRVALESRGYMDGAL